MHVSMEMSKARVIIIGQETEMEIRSDPREMMAALLMRSLTACLPSRLGLASYSFVPAIPHAFLRSVASGIGGIASCVAAGPEQAELEAAVLQQPCP